MSTHSCTVIHAGLITDPVSRQRLLFFQAVLESPFTTHPFTAIPPPAALFESSDWLLLFLISFTYFLNLLIIYSLLLILSTVFTMINGIGGSRTRVQRPIPCPSTIIVDYFGKPSFPPKPGNRHPGLFSSFMIRPQVQSLARVVSYIVDARFLMCRCTSSDSCL